MTIVPFSAFRVRIFQCKAIVRLCPCARLVASASAMQIRSSMAAWALGHSVHGVLFATVLQWRAPSEGSLFRFSPWQQPLLCLGGRLLSPPGSAAPATAHGGFRGDPPEFLLVRVFTNRSYRSLVGANLALQFRPEGIADTI
jgi:hypothetical protein